MPQVHQEGIQREYDSRLLLPNSKEIAKTRPYPTFCFLKSSWVLGIWLDTYSLQTRMVNKDLADFINDGAESRLRIIIPSILPSSSVSGQPTTGARHRSSAISLRWNQEENKHSILSSSEQLGGFNAICMLRRLILLSRMALTMRNFSELFPELFSENSSMLNISNRWP